jgi:hypothetical protein
MRLVIEIGAIVCIVAGLLIIAWIGVDLLAPMWTSPLQSSP